MKPTKASYTVPAHTHPVGQEVSPSSSRMADPVFRPHTGAGVFFNGTSPATRNTTSRAVNWSIATKPETNAAAPPSACRSAIRIARSV
ncbi:MAG: hypothetical protein M0Z99_02685, partial [Betaproteobacteria bacterium]|nr:hypothetical protein [Betaproteobacteria bacterium]